MYPFYEKAQKSGIRNVCVHKGLFPQQAEERLPHLAVHAAVGDVGRAAKDWPGLNFVVYHSGYRHLGGPPQHAVDEWEQRGRLSWLSDLAEIPGRFGVGNVYGDLGAIFGWTVLAQPRLAAAMLGTLIKGLGADHVIWGTDSIWTGSPQWQIEALRRLEIPEDMQRTTRVRAARRGRWCGENRDPGRQRTAFVQVRTARRTDGERQGCLPEGSLPATGTSAQQHAVWARRGRRGS